MRQESKKKYWKRNHQLRLQCLYDKTSNSYPSPVVWSEYECDSYSPYHSKKAENAYLKRSYRSQTSAYLKRQSSKAVRRTKDLASGKGGYRKTVDLWWELY